MTETGDRYTQARATLRPDTPSPGPDATTEKHSFPGPVMPITVEDLVARHHHTVAPAAGDPAATFGSRWEVSVEAGGRLEVLDPPRLPTAAVAALGDSVGGVGYVAFGLDTILPAEDGATIEDRNTPPAREVRIANHQRIGRVQVEFLRILRDDFGIDLLQGDDRLARSCRIGRLHPVDQGVVRPARFRSQMLLGVGGLDEVLGVWLDPRSWLEGAQDLPGAPWAAFGVIVDVEVRFAVADPPTNPPAHLIGALPARPEIDEKFWTQTGHAFQSAAIATALPPWPLLGASVREPGPRMPGTMREWQSFDCLPPPGERAPS